MAKNTGGPAFPDPDGFSYEGITVRDWFAAHAPVCPADWIATQQALDRQRNPYNESYKKSIRDTVEIIADWNYEYADAMMRTRESK